MTSTDATAASAIRYVADWPPAPAEAEAIRRFWIDEAALNDEAQIAQRLPQVVMHAVDGDKVAAVCTAVATTPPAFGQPVYYYRSFVGKAWRRTTLVERLLRRAQAFLEEHARERGFPCIGILLELEGARFKDKGRMPVWPHSGFTYVGKSGRGLEMRVYYFEGAKLKAAK